MTIITLSKLKQFCNLSKINYSSSDTKETLKRKVKKYLNKYKYAPRYLHGLTPNDKFIKMFEIRFYKLKEKMGKIPSSKKYKPSSIDIKYSKKKLNKSKKISKYTKSWNKKYGSKSTSLSSKSKISGVPLSILKKVYNKGLAAWRGSSHRPGAAQHQWGVSRVNSFLTCGKTWYFPDHKLAKEAMKRSSKTRKLWSNKKCIKSRMGKRTKSI
jgi:hypothetical protein